MPGRPLRLRPLRLCRPSLHRPSLHRPSLHRLRPAGPELSHRVLATSPA